MNRVLCLSLALAFIGGSPLGHAAGGPSDNRPREVTSRSPRIAEEFAPSDFDLAAVQWHQLTDKELIDLPKGSIRKAFEERLIKEPTRKKLQVRRRKLGNRRSVQRGSLAKMERLREAELAKTKLEEQLQQAHAVIAELREQLQQAPAVIAEPQEHPDNPAIIAELTARVLELESEKSAQVKSLEGLQSTVKLHMEGDNRTIERFGKRLERKAGKAKVRLPKLCEHWHKDPKFIALIRKTDVAQQEYHAVISPFRDHFVVAKKALAFDRQLNKLLKYDPGPKPADGCE